MFHKHKFVFDRACYAAPHTQGFKTRGFGGDAQIEKILMGVTTFIYRCSDEECGKLKKIEALGKQVDNDTRTVD